MANGRRGGNVISTSSSSNSGNYTIEELQAQLEEVEREIERNGQSDALLAEAERLKEAIEELMQAKKDEIAAIEEAIEQGMYLDKVYRARLEERINELRAYISLLGTIRDTIHDSLPMSNNHETASVLALAAEKVFGIATSGSNFSPRVENAANRLKNVTQGVVNSASHYLPALAGFCLTAAQAGDPITITTGNFYYTKEDMLIPGRYPLTFTRTYNALGGREGVLGHGWSHSFDIRLYQNENNLHITFADGHAEQYSRIEEGFYVAPLDRKNTLIVPKKNEQDEQDYAYDLILPDGIRYRFGQPGESNTCPLLRIDDPNGNGTNLEYEANGVLLTKATYLLNNQWRQKISNKYLKRN